MMAALLASAPHVDAVFVASDLVASGALAALQAAGRRVLEDVAIGGFDDSKVAVQTSPALTTIRQPLERVAAEMVDVLLACVADERPSSPLLSTELIRRDSACTCCACDLTRPAAGRRQGRPGTRCSPAGPPSMARGPVARGGNRPPAWCKQVRSRGCLFPVSVGVSGEGVSAFVDVVVVVVAEVGEVR